MAGKKRPDIDTVQSHLAEDKEKPANAHHGGPLNAVLVVTAY